MGPPRAPLPRSVCPPSGEGTGGEGGRGIGIGIGIGISIGIGIGIGAEDPAGSFHGQKEDAVVNIRAPNNAGSEREQATTTAARPVMKDILVN